MTQAPLLGPRTGLKGIPFRHADFGGIAGSEKRVFSLAAERLREETLCPYLGNRRLLTIVPGATPTAGHNPDDIGDTNEPGEYPQKGAAAGLTAKPMPSPSMNV